MHLNKPNCKSKINVSVNVNEDIVLLRVVSFYCYNKCTISSSYIKQNCQGDISPFNYFALKRVSLIGMNAKGDGLWFRAPCCCDLYGKNSFL